MSCGQLVIKACTIVHKVHPSNYPHSPSLSKMVTVVVSPPGTNEAGAVTLPEITKFSVPSRSWSSWILITRTWTLLWLVPWSNVTFVSNVSVEFTREKSSPSARRRREQHIKKEILKNWLLAIDSFNVTIHVIAIATYIPVALPLTTATVTIIGSWRVTLGGSSRYWIFSFTTLSSLAVVVFSRNWTWIAVCVHVKANYR